MAVIRGKVQWASVLEDFPNTHFEPKWSIDVILDAESKKLVESLGLGDKIKQNKDGDDAISIGRKCETSKGTKRPAPKVIGKNGVAFTEPIGNGSVCRVQFRADEWEYGKKSGIRADLQGVLVEEHVPYAGGDGSELKEFIDEDAPF